MEHKFANKYLFFLSLCFKILTFRIKGILYFLFYLKFVFSYVSQKLKAWTAKTRVNSNCEQAKQGLDYSERVCKEDMVLVLEKLGMNAQCDGDGVEEFGVKEIGELFDDEGFTLSELEEAFDVFDQNKDGFIEARELQRILSCLGLGKDLMECQKMINVVDQNGDQLIDHNEFAKMMEQSFG